MKILHVLDHSIPLHSGYAFRTYALLKEQIKRGWDTVHLTGSKHYLESADSEEVDGLLFYRTQVQKNLLDQIPILNQMRVISTLAKRLEEVVLEERPDIIHAHSPCLIGLAALKVGKKHNVPMVYEVRASWEDAAVEHGSTTENSVRYRLSKHLETYVLNHANGLSTICHGLKNDILSRGVSDVPIAVVPNAVDSSCFPEIAEGSEELREKFKLSGQTVLGFIGSFYAYEGIDLLIEAVAHLKAEGRSVVALLVGGGPEEQSLKKLARELDVSQEVVFVGRVPHEEVNQYYQLIDILVYARKASRLTEIVTPLKPLEAMAMGKPFIASDVGGHRELIPEQLHDLLFTPNNVNDLVKRIFGLEQKGGAVSAFDGWTREHVAEKRTWAKSVENYESLYSQVLANMS